MRWEVGEGADVFILANKNIPEPVPADWVVEAIDDKTSRVRLNQPLDMFYPALPHGGTSGGPVAQRF